MLCILVLVCSFTSGLRIIAMVLRILYSSGIYDARYVVAQFREPKRKIRAKMRTKCETSPFLSVVGVRALPGPVFLCSGQVDYPISKSGGLMLIPTNAMRVKSYPFCSKYEDIQHATGYGKHSKNPMELCEKPVSLS